MNEDGFWQIIEQSSDAVPNAQNRKLRSLLDALPIAEIKAFDRIFDELIGKAYTWDLWGAAYVLDGGCSDDGFEYFRRGLTGAGREKFEAALRDPDSLANWAEPDEVENEGIRYVVYRAYQAKTGTKDLPDHGIRFPKEPSGEAWSEDGDDLEKRFPKLWAKTVV
jgi:hypothetical protein